MRLLAALLAIVTSSLMFGTYVGMNTLSLVNERAATGYLLGCGLGIQKSKGYSTPLSPAEIAYCLTASLLFKDILDKNSDK